MDGLLNELSGLSSNISEFSGQHPLKTLAIGGAIVGGVVGSALVVKKIKKRITSHKKKIRKHTTKCRPCRVSKRKRKGRKLKFGSKAYRKKYLSGRKKKKISPKYARTAGKRRDTSTRRIRMTSKGQPYIILSNGRARFIKKSSARRDRKLKGGKY